MSSSAATWILVVSGALSNYDHRFETEGPVFAAHAECESVGEHMLRGIATDPGDVEAASAVCWPLPRRDMGPVVGFYSRTTGLDLVFGTPWHCSFVEPEAKYRDCSRAHIEEMKRAFR
jgi:hypothetical protein